MTLEPRSIETALDARLERGSDRPLAVAFSGGGDSLALLLMAKRWADRAGRTLIAFTVDHRLQTQSGAWAVWCAHRAARLDVRHEILAWEDAKPARGLSAAARLARHRLIADAARGVGARVVLLGHTADDVLEADLMRQAGVRVSSPIAWSPSPVWPAGRDLFILRPLLTTRRAAIRAWLANQGEIWIEDPANENPLHPRARARPVAAAMPFAGEPARPGPKLCGMRIGPAGDISFLRGKDPQIGTLAAAIACAAGAETPPRRTAVARLASRLADGEPLAATLGGARIVAADDVVITRETGDARGRGWVTLALSPGSPVVWDGRFEALAITDGLTLTTLRGHASRLDRRQREKVKALDPRVRAALPALIDASGGVTLPSVDPDPRLVLRNLVHGRLAGALGAIDTEAQIGLYG